VKRTNYEAPHYVAFSSLAPLPPSSFMIFSSAPCSQAPSICAPLSVWETKFHTHAKRAKL